MYSRERKFDVMTSDCGIRAPVHPFKLICFTYYSAHVKENKIFIFAYCGSRWKNASGLESIISLNCGKYFKV